MALDFGAGCAGGKLELNLDEDILVLFFCFFLFFFGILVGYPLDTVKVRIQTQDPTNLKYRGTFQCLSSIIKDEGVRLLHHSVLNVHFSIQNFDLTKKNVDGNFRSKSRFCKL